MLQQTFLIMSDFRGGEVQGRAVAPLVDRGWVCVGFRGESGVCCSRFPLLRECDDFLFGVCCAAGRTRRRTENAACVCATVTMCRFRSLFSTTNTPLPLRAPSHHRDVRMSFFIESMYNIKALANVSASEFHSRGELRHEKCD